MIRKMLILFSILAIVVSVFAFTSGNAHAQNRVRQSSCAVLSVQLHGKIPPTYKCLAVKATNITWGTCLSGSTEIFDGLYQSNDILCVSGSGTLNLTSVPLGSGTWNDRAESYYTNCSAVGFYKDTNLGGSSVYENVYHSDNFGPGAVPIKSLSSIYRYNNC